LTSIETAVIWRCWSDGVAELGVSVSPACFRRAFSWSTEIVCVIDWSAAGASLGLILSARVSASTNSVALVKRSPGILASARARTASTALGSPAPRSLALGTGLLM
jgi:hypothetical protein